MFDDNEKESYGKLMKSDNQHVKSDPALPSTTQTSAARFCPPAAGSLTTMRWSEGHKDNTQWFCSKHRKEVCQSKINFERLLLRTAPRFRRAASLHTGFSTGNHIKSATLSCTSLASTIADVSWDETSLEY